MLSFIHLSDIHFRRYSGDLYDIDNDLRAELIHDISHRLLKQIPSIDGILICGDIAFSGQEDEYSAASTFLEEICDTLTLDKKRIFCVPGNHDIDQNITRSSFSVKALQQTLEQADNLAVFDDNLAKIFRNAQDSEILYSPLMCYNEKFAAQYGCSLAPDKVMWMQEIEFDFGYKLCIVGINSTIISNHEDHRDDKTERLMRIGDMQIPSRKDNTIFLSLCHHPPECWNDPEQKLSKKISKRIAIQLYGHKHMQVLENVDNTIIVRSGATHPSRFEDGWIPRYNWISIEVNRLDGKDTLKVKIYPRVLSEDESSFEPDYNILNGKEHLEFSIDLSTDDTVGRSTIKDSILAEDPPVLSVSSWERKFIYDFMNLPFIKRDLILKKFLLGKPEDEGMRHIELLDKFITRAKEKKCVAQLIAEIEKEKVRYE